MEPRVGFITLAVPDLEAAFAFYVEGLGWEPAMHVPDDVLMIRVGDKLLLSLWVEAGFEGEVGPIRRGEGHAPITLAHNLPTRKEVDAVLEQARLPGRPTSARRSSATGAVTPATSAIRPAIAGRSPTTPVPSGSPSCPEGRCHEPGDEGEHHGRDPHPLPDPRAAA